MYWRPGKPRKEQWLQETADFPASPGLLAPPLLPAPWTDKPEAAGAPTKPQGCPKDGAGTGEVWPLPWGDSSWPGPRLACQEGWEAGAGNSQDEGPSSL